MVHVARVKRQEVRTTFWLGSLKGIIERRQNGRQYLKGS
jgi:hypothetical protein